MTQPTTLPELLAASSRSTRSITYLEGENQRRVVPYSTLHERALGMLHHLQAMGAKRGDHLDPVSAQQRSVHRRLLGASWAASCRCRWRSASATSTDASCCASRSSSIGRSLFGTQDLERIEAVRRRPAVTRPRWKRCARARCSSTRNCGSVAWPAFLRVSRRTMSPSSSSRRVRPASRRASC
jgi:hypothetical protein